MKRPFKSIAFCAFWGACFALELIHGSDTGNMPISATAQRIGLQGNQDSSPISFESTIDGLREKADAGDAESQADLGKCYFNGDGVGKDTVEAVKWFRRAADQGVARAQFNLGNAYYRGDGVDKDVVEATKWYRKAADQDDADAQNDLGLCYKEGEGVKQDLVEAVKWYRKASDQGFAKAEFNLGNAYYKGEGVEKDSAEAARLYRMAADQNDADAQFNLGVCYYNGDGVNKNVIEAAKWYRKAADQGQSRAQFYLGGCFLTGFGVIKNETEGLAWLYVSSANGDEGAQTSIANYEKVYDTSLIMAARQRATDIQNQIASNPEPSSESAAYTAITTISGSTPKASGSGAFITADGLILTAAHVVTGASRIEVVMATSTLVATVVKIDATNDVALLKCSGSNFTALPIAPSKGDRPGTTVFTIGFPNIQIQGFDPKLTKGEISSLAGIQDDPRQWQISVPIQPGNSGGPLCDENGNLIGMVEATLDPLVMAKIAGEIPQNVNYAVKSSYIIPLLDDVQNLPLPRTSSNGQKFEDVVESVRPSIALILVY